MKLTLCIMTSNNAFAVRTCIVVVTHKSSMASYISEAGNLNGIYAYVCSDVAKPSSSGSGDFFDLPDRSNTTYFYDFPHN